ncbi:hypothetical protein EDB85DRAFT_2149527 [Lactarius pseudohatsudake]|nr:hypothetical protein EDB85DRAFT_2149527 [Lactarius pseudohatsudake]
MIILQKPHKWKAADYKIPIPPEVLNEIKKKYALPDDPVFELVPPEFAVHANTVWTSDLKARLGLKATALAQLMGARLF